MGRVRIELTHNADQLSAFCFNPNLPDAYFTCLLSNTQQSVANVSVAIAQVCRRSWAVPCPAVRGSRESRAAAEA
jgi:hypothetical protein